jgi:hypothetical protein
MSFGQLGSRADREKLPAPAQVRGFFFALKQFNPLAGILVFEEKRNPPHRTGVGGGLQWD